MVLFFVASFVSAHTHTNTHCASHRDYSPFNIFVEFHFVFLKLTHTHTLKLTVKARFCACTQKFLMDVDKMFNVRRLISAWVDEAPKKGRRYVHSINCQILILKRKRLIVYTRIYMEYGCIYTQRQYGMLIKYACITVENSNFSLVENDDDDDNDNDNNNDSWRENVGKF